MTRPAFFTQSPEPRAYRGSWPIRDHRTLAEIGFADPAAQPTANVVFFPGSSNEAGFDCTMPDLRIEQDEVDATHAREVVRVYRVALRNQPLERTSVAMRITLALGVVGGALLAMAAIYLMAMLILVLSCLIGGGQ